MKIVFAGGGTGGHIYPALAVAKEIMNRQPGAEVLFVGGTKGIERKIVSDAGYTLETIPVSGLPRKVSLSMVGFFWKLGVSIVMSRRVLKRFRPSVVMATGGYVSGPPIIAALSLGLPTVILEQNSYPGITNRKLGRFADIVFLGFQDAAPFFERKAETMVTGNPVRDTISAGRRDESARKFGLDPSLRTVLVFGGSQGSAAINRAVSGAAESIAARDIQVLWQTGALEYTMWKPFDKRCDGRIRVVPYIDAMEHAYAAADCVVARAGAMSIAEITACGLPAVFIPLPTAAANHQELNAQSLVTAGAAAMIIEKNLTSDSLEREIVRILLSQERIAAMSRASKNLGRPEAAKNIAGIILERYGCPT